MIHDNYISLIYLTVLTSSFLRHCICHLSQVGVKNILPLYLVINHANINKRGSDVVVSLLEKSPESITTRTCISNKWDKKLMLKSETSSHKLPVENLGNKLRVGFGGGCHHDE